MKRKTMLDIERRWRLSIEATEEERAMFELAQAQDNDRVGRRERGRMLQRLWKRGAIITQPLAGTEPEASA